MRSLKWCSSPKEHAGTQDRVTRRTKFPCKHCASRFTSPCEPVLCIVMILTNSAGTLFWWCLLVLVSLCSTLHPCPSPVKTAEGETALGQAGKAAVPPRKPPTTSHLLCKPATWNDQILLWGLLSEQGSPAGADTALHKQPSSLCSALTILFPAKVASLKHQVLLLLTHKEDMVASFPSLQRSRRRDCALSLWPSHQFLWLWPSHHPSYLWPEGSILIPHQPDHPKHRILLLDGACDTRTPIFRDG